MSSYFLYYIVGYINSPEKAVSGLSEHDRERMDRECPRESSVVMTRSSLEDKELETRALSEPLPTNQQVQNDSIF